MTTERDAGETGFKQDMQRVGDSVGTLKTDGKNLAHDAATAARSGAAELRQGAAHAVDAAKDKIQGAKDAANEAADSLKEIVTAHPLASIGIAAGIGLLVGMAMCRPRS